MRISLLGAFGASSLDLNVRVYALVTEWNEYHAVREDLYFGFMEVIEVFGTAVAFPATPGDFASSFQWYSYTGNYA